MLTNTFECTECNDIQKWHDDLCMKRCNVTGCDGVYAEIFPDPTESSLPQYIQEKRMECWVKSAIASTGINNALPPTEYADLMLSQFDKTFNINQNP